MPRFLRLDLNGAPRRPLPGALPQDDISPAEYCFNRLIPRHVGPFLGRLYYGLSGLPEEVVVRDFNERGLYFWTTVTTPLNATVELELELPSDVGLCGGRAARYRATVIRVEPGTEANFGVAALIKGCTPL